MPDQEEFFPCLMIKGRVAPPEAMNSEGEFEPTRRQDRQVFQGRLLETAIIFPVMTPLRLPSCITGRKKQSEERAALFAAGVYALLTPRGRNTQKA
jgi:hypothetical protein